MAVVKEMSSISRSVFFEYGFHTAEAELRPDTACEGCCSCHLLLTATLKSAGSTPLDDGRIRDVACVS